MTKKCGVCGKTATHYLVWAYGNGKLENMNYLYYCAKHKIDNINEIDIGCFSHGKL